MNFRDDTKIKYKDGDEIRVGTVCRHNFPVEDEIVNKLEFKVGDKIKDKENGFLVKYKDIDDLYDKLSLLAEDRLLCKSLGKNAYNDIKNNLSIEKMMDKIEDIYNNIR